MFVDVKIRMERDDELGHYTFRLNGLTYKETQELEKELQALEKKYS